MKKEIVILFCLSLFHRILFSQDSVFIAENQYPYLKKDSLYNSYGMLLKDDPLYNKRTSVVVPAIEVVAINGFIWTIDRYVLDQPTARISPDTWKTNIQKGWKWDDNSLRINFIGHPYSGSLYFNAVRSNGYSYLQSVPFVIAGSTMWEYFGETERPSYNDIINTTMSGSFLGEVLYRFSSKLLNDRTRSRSRVARELTAAVLNPMRSFNRVIQGKAFRTTEKETYQKEPFNFSISGGMHRLGESFHSSAATYVPMMNIRMDYGDPFEIRARKPFDVFRLTVDLSHGSGLKLPNSITGYGLLGGRNVKTGNTTMLAGGFQHYDFWQSRKAELAAVGIGGGIIGKTQPGAAIDLYSSLHIAAVPLGGVNIQRTSDTATVRNYNYGGGFQGKLETTINIGKCISISLNGYYYWIHTYEGSAPEEYLKNNSMGILKPRISFWFTRNISIGAEQLWYYINGFTSSAKSSSWSEQKFFLQLFLENPRRPGSRYY